MTDGTELNPPRQGRFPSPLAQPEYGAGAAIAPAPPAVAPLPDLPSRGRVAPGWLWIVLGVLLLGLGVYFAGMIGVAPSLIGFIAALFPYAVVLGTVVVIDRWEPEPKGLVFFALAWGGIASIALTLIFGLPFTILTIMLGAPDYWGAVVQAPLMEEFFKVAGLVLLLWIGRRAFDGPVDGIVYGAMIGAGFAFTENIQYFAGAVVEGGFEQLAQLFVLRGVMSPFCHSMFTAVAGYMIGRAVRDGAGPGRRLAYGALGYAGAVLLHAVWNGGATFAVDGDAWGTFYLFQMALFALFIVGIVLLRREERRLTRERLGDYAAAGWFTPQEVDMLATPAGRRTGRQWAAHLPGDRRGLMTSFIRDAASLAAARQRAVSGRDPQAAQDEHVLLARITETRRQLLSS
ncbi:PrsW family intramembrane metalloprotease [Microbacterium sp. NPDC096154]|uniref:PrsW family intramembrane metalloprotease n=1 Tax=Microbacterium sp. NPDC096154 TaxID=3155549 RepID=UPI00331654F7